MMLQSFSRPLAPAERRLLRAKIRDLESRINRGPRVLIPGAVIVGILWVLTLLASGSSWPVVSAFWMVVGGGILLWVRRDLKKDLGVLRDMLREYESALRSDEAKAEMRPIDLRSMSF